MVCVNLKTESLLLHVICRLLSTAKVLRELFCAILQITLRFLKFTLALVTSDNMQVSLYEALSPGICLTRASVT